MAENKLIFKVTLEHLDEEGFFTCPSCPFDALIYINEHCPQCGVKLDWDKNLVKIKKVFRNCI